MKEGLIVKRCVALLVGLLVWCVALLAVLLDHTCWYFLPSASSLERKPQQQQRFELWTTDLLAQEGKERPVKGSNQRAVKPSPRILVLEVNGTQMFWRPEAVASHKFCIKIHEDPVMSGEIGSPFSTYEALLLQGTLQIEVAPPVNLTTKLSDYGMIRNRFPHSKPWRSRSKTHCKSYLKQLRHLDESSKFTRLFFLGILRTTYTLATQTTSFFDFSQGIAYNARSPTLEFYRFFIFDILTKRLKWKPSCFMISNYDMHLILVYLEVSSLLSRCLGKRVPTQAVEMGCAAGFSH